MPEKGITKVYTTIKYQRVRDVDAKKQTLFTDMILTMRWFDPNIKTKFSNIKERLEGIILKSGPIQKIWTPDLYIWNQTSAKEKVKWALQKNTKLFSSLDINSIADPQSSGRITSKTLVEMVYEIKTEIFCKFSYSEYPMDKQTCNVTINSGSNEAIFVLNDQNGAYHSSTSYKALNLKMTTTFFDENIKNGRNKIGFEIRMKRQMQSFWMKYYVPCIAIVLVSEIGFVVPLTAIPGRAALLVTQFLTLVNLFIFQMVISTSFEIVFYSKIF